MSEMSKDLLEWMTENREKRHSKIDQAIKSLVSLQNLCDEVVLELSSLKKKIKPDPS